MCGRLEHSDLGLREGSILRALTPLLMRKGREKADGTSAMGW